MYSKPNESIREPFTESRWDGRNIGVRKVERLDDPDGAIERRFQTNLNRLFPNRNRDYIAKG
jgi:hypothetical protein